SCVLRRFASFFLSCILYPAACTLYCCSIYRCSLKNRGKLAHAMALAGSAVSASRVANSNQVPDPRPRQSAHSSEPHNVSFKLRIRPPWLFTP
ncbi:hypothetical protein V8E53_000528, partial [Lactarius tabidus]